MKINPAIAQDNSYLLKAILDKVSIFSDLEIKFSASNGVELLQKLSKDPTIHVILMDIEMTKMNGIEAVVRIKQRYPQI